ncbi:unnamed protein product [Auanema sp. JU1783]|nr:unnamed protein product [Auanema sp. JU1783]
MFCKSALVAVVLVALAAANPVPAGVAEKMPEFLKNLSEAARGEFMTIVQNESLTIAEQRAQLLAWADKNGLRDKVDEFEKKITDKAGVMEEKANAAGIPSDKIAEIKSIFLNENQTRKQQMEALKQFKDNNQEVMNHTIPTII